MRSHPAKSNNHAANITADQVKVHRNSHLTQPAGWLFLFILRDNNAKHQRQYCNQQQATLYNQTECFKYCHPPHPPFKREFSRHLLYELLLLLVYQFYEIYSTENPQKIYVLQRTSIVRKGYTLYFTLHKHESRLTLLPKKH